MIDNEDYLSKTLIFIDIREYGKFRVFFVTVRTIKTTRPRILMNVCCLKYMCMVYLSNMLMYVSMSY